MCDVCSEFSQLLVNCESRLTDDVSQYPTITQSELEIVLNYILSWPQRQCMCCYRDVKNFERFYLVVQSILCLSVCQLKQLKDELVEAAKTAPAPAPPQPPENAEDKQKPEEDSSGEPVEEKNNEEKESPEVPDEPAPTADTQEEPKNAETPPSSTEDTELWSMQQKEKLMHIVSKVFLLNFPLYLACKHSALCRLDDLSAQEISNLSLYCDLHDTEIPAYLLRNVSFFCKLGGVCAMTSVFEHATQSTLPLSMAHAIVAAVGNLKLWLNFRAVSQLFMPLRAKILKYMCTLEDKDLRVPAVKSMADFMWGAAKEPLDVPLTFDGDGLALAFKYFNSSTLTMRLAGVAQINAHIASHNELCAGESATDAEVAGQQLATWLTNNNIIEHLFGPNLHVEVIKQSHMILKFLAVEGRVTPEHVELVWAAAQLKHCGRQVYDLLPGFIRALAPKPCAHLYSLLCALPPKEHTEQSLYLASALMRAMWSRGASGTLGTSPSALADDPPLRPPQPSCKPHHNSSSEASVSMDQTNSDDDPCEELSTSGEEAGPTPRKQSKHQRDLTAEQEWLREGEELTKKECPTLKSCQKRNKRAGSSGSASSGAEEMLRPRKKKFYKKRHKPGKPKHFPTQLKTADLAESVSEVEEESSGSDTAHCQLICDNVDARRLMELRLMESYKRRGAAGEEEEGSASSALSPHSHPHLADLDEDDSACEEELARLAAQAQCLTEYQSTGAAGSKRARGSPPAPACDVDDVCRPGNTLLWDLLQDGAIEQLGEGLALEAEKALCALLCFSTDKFIRIKFIEGCLDNLANHRSVAVSLRLLPKLFSSFQQLRGMDMHQVVMWAERERGMMRLFLEDLRHYMAQPRPVCDAPHYAHITELTVRLHFLTAIFSPVGSPQHFRLTVEQVEELWQCLVVRGSSECADCLYSWLLSHTKSPDQHALGLDALRFLYVEKMPTLDPETISIMGLSLYQQLCNLARMALGTGDSRDAAHPHTLAMDHLWKIALRANSTDVSMGAIQYLNSYYMGQQLQQEDDFVAKCMFHLSSAAERLITKKHNTVDGEVPSTSQMNEQDVKEEKIHDKQNIYEHMTEEAALQCIQRALLLLKTHLDTFKRRYAYHLRRWALAESGAWEGTCGGGSAVRVTLQPAGAGPRASLAMHHADLVAHLRAHVHVWWETQIQGEDNVTALSTDGPLRMITQGQELTIDYDERTLYDMGFKDNQLVFVSVGVGGRGAWAEWPSAQPAPARTRLPTLLLLDPTYFHHLFTLMQALGQMKEPGANGELITHTKAQLLSRRVWDILQAVPLNPTLLEAFQNPIESNLPELLDPTSPQKLMYYLHIIDKLSSSHTGASIIRENTVSTLSPLISHEKSEEDKAAVQRWNELFIRKGGLRLLYDIMMSGVLQRNDDSEWRQDCLALLLQLLCRIGTLPLTDPAQTPKLHPSLLSLMSVEETTERLISILCEAATLKEPTTYKTGFWGRAQVVQHAMRMCVWWARGGGDAVALAWSLRRAAPRLLLDDADPAVSGTSLCNHITMRMCVWWARGGGDAVALAWSLRRAAPRLLLDDADPAVSGTSLCNHITMRMCVWWARGGGDAVALAWSLRRAAPRLLLDDADPAVSGTSLCNHITMRMCVWWARGGGDAVALAWSLRRAAPRLLLDDADPAVSGTSLCNHITMRMCVWWARGGGDAVALAWSLRRAAPRLLLDDADPAVSGTSLCNHITMRMCVWWARGGGDAVALAWSLRRAAPRLLLDDADPAVSGTSLCNHITMRMCVWWARGGGDAVALAWSLRRAAPRLLLDDADPAVSGTSLCNHITMRMCVWWARGGGDAVALAWSLRRAAPRLLLDDADPAVSGTSLCNHITMRMCVWWARGGGDAVALAWSLRRAAPRLLLDDADPAVRREAGSALYRLCAGGEVAVLAPLLQLLLEHLPRAADMRPHHHHHHHHHHDVVHHHVEEGKEPYGPACRDYFWLVCRLIDGLPEDFFKEGATSEDSGAPDLNELCEQIHTALEKREIIERRTEPCSPDDGLYGQLSLLTHLLKHPLRFKMSDQGTRTLEMVFGFLFDVPNPENRNLPKCKSQKSRAAAYDLLVELVRGAPDNYMVLHNKLMEHHKPGPQSTYPWDYWPAEESRSECGYVGLTNLGATCYMASCMQHLYMMPQARAALLQADPAASRHSATLHEMQRMFAYLMESERKAYNPRSFCKVYQMDHQPLNTGEQKDMAEFFIDLVSKLEEMTPELKKLVKTLFCGVLSNNVVSLDCPHVSRTLEEFYTVRCQVADMRNLHQSLDEVTVKDTLEGDNCYTCSQCAAKVRAEKRACFKKLPRILCFNTMRYTFNMLTMLKEKVNTHFSFPMRLDMSGYVEKHLMPAQYQEEKNKLLAEKKDGEASPTAAEVEDNSEFEEHYEYELIGVTVHTGTADGGHYYSFIRDREHEHHDRWLLFNDAEVKAFDPAHLASECFGGEMTSKTYDSVTDKFMDFSFEKTNSAYMLFYEWSPPRSQRGSECGQQEDPQPSTAEGASPSSSVERRSSDASPGVKLPPDLLKWIWDDNMQFLHDKNIFQHAYFTFMGQMCSSVPQSLMTLKPEVTEVAARLSTSFFIETFIHAKEKPTMVSWVELVTKQFNASAAASEWFLGHMADDTWWPMQVLIKCPNQMVRQMFQRLCMHVIQRLRSSHCALYLQGMEEGEDNSKLGEASCVTRFIRMLLSLMENGARSHLRHLTEYFSLLYEFSKMGEEEGKFMLRINAISSMVNFYLGQNATVTESPTEEAGGSGSGSTNAESGGDKLRPGALDKMVALVAGLVERSRDAAGHLALLEPDARALLHAKGFPFIYQQTRDCLNLQQTRSLIFALCRWNEPLAQKIVNMIFQAIAKHSESCGPFFKLLTLLVEGSGGGAGATGGLPCFTQLVLARLWDVADVCPHAALEWLALQVPRNKAAHAWALRTAERWVEGQLLGAGAARVRAAAALLLVALVPSQHFRAGYARARPPAPPHQPHAPHPPHANHAKLPDTAHHTLHQVYTMLLGKLKAARKYTDVAVHGTMKLTAYFGVMSYCVVSRVEKLMFGQYFNDLWELYHPAISEPSVAVHPNKQALLTFWHAVSVDCPENVQLAVANQRLTKHIAFNYILADHEDGEVVAYNRAMLPPYYALLRLCCRRSSSFARSLAQHQNIHWAFRNIAPHAHLYPGAADELLRLARILAARGGNGNGNNGSTSSGNGSGNGASSGSESADGREAAAFRRSTLSAYLQGLNGRTCWSTLISAFCTLVENEDDRLYVVYNGGLQMTFEALHSLHAVYVDGGGAGGSAGAVRAELTAALRWARALCRTLRTRRDNKEARALLLACKDWPECARRLLTMLNLHHRHNHLRDAALGVLREVVMIGGGAALGALVPLAAGAQCGARPRPPACAAPAALAPHDKHNAHRLATSYRPYHKFIDTCCRVARSQRCMSEQLVLLSALCALEAVPLRFNYFAAFWRDVATSPADSKLEEMLLECSVATEYVDAVLLDERESLEDPVIYQFMQHYYPKLGGGGSNGSDNADGTDSGSGAGSGAAEALLEELMSGAARAPLRALLAPARALALLHARAALGPARARELQRLTRALRARLQQATEEESSEPESGCAGGPSNTATRGGSGSGSSGDDAASEAAEPDSEPDEATPRGAALTHLAHALDALDALAGAGAGPPQPPEP